MLSFVRSLQGASAFFPWKGAAVLIFFGLLLHVVGGTRHLTAFEVFTGGQSMFVAAIGSFFFSSAVIMGCTPSVSLVLLLPNVQPKIIFALIVFIFALILLLISWTFSVFGEGGLNPNYSWGISGGIGVFAAGIFRDDSLRLLAASFLCIITMIVSWIFSDEELVHAFSVNAVMAGSAFPAITLVFCAFLWLVGGLLLMRQVDYEK